jgi:Protein of unknown function (DUF2933)
MTAGQCNTVPGGKLGWAIAVSLAALGAYLLWAHTGHLLAALPFLLLLLCPLMHVFGHHHGLHEHDQRSETLK